MKPSPQRGDPGRNSRLRISCDFDGTITRRDTVQLLLDYFADPAWREIEAEWNEGRIGSRECLERQTRLIRVSPEALTAWVDRQPVDPEVSGFFADCGRLGLELRVVSDGYDWVIRRVMRRLGLEHTPIVANRLVPEGGDRWRVEFPHFRENCTSGACKCAAVGEAGVRVHIGDGRSDLCVSDICDVVFAKSTLLASRTARGLLSIPFDDFSDIRSLLPKLAERGLASGNDIVTKVAC